MCPPDRHGNCSLGFSVEASRATCDVTDKIIAHINPKMPRTHGESFIPINDIDHAYTESVPMLEVVRGETNATGAETKWIVFEDEVTSLVRTKAFVFETEEYRSRHKAK